MNKPIIALDLDGRVILNDERLAEIEAAAALYAGGDDPPPQTTNDTCEGHNNNCRNRWCRKTTNTVCSNWVACPSESGVE